MTTNTRAAFTEAQTKWQAFAMSTRPASPRAVEAMPRADDFSAPSRTDAERAEDYTRECLSDWYNS